VSCSRRAALGTLVSVLLSEAAPAATEPRKIYLQPLGKELSASEVEMVRAGLRAFYDFEVVLRPRIPLPAAAYYPPRQRYRAEKLLRTLEQHRPADGLRILGLTAVDISTTKPPHADWGILGLATIDGRACVISSFRTKRGAASAKHARERLGKTAVHEIGHTLGLGHCEERGCLMEDGRGTVLTTDRCYDLCPACRRELLRRGHPLTTSDPSGDPIPWPPPGTKPSPK
jgi:archaemetzincin